MSKKEAKNPIEFLLQTEQIPSAWCSGCGIGIVVNSFLQAVKKNNLDPNRICVLSSGHGCIGNIPGHLKFKEPKKRERNVFLSARIYKYENPDSHVVVFLNDSDFIAIGVDDLIETCKKGCELIVIYINSFIYHVFMERKAFRQTLFKRNSTGNNLCSPFNIPHLAKVCGASFIARWTPLHCRRITFSIQRAFLKQGFSLIEVISPCLMYYSSKGEAGKTIDRMGMFYDNSVIKSQESTGNLDIRSGKEIIVGKFVDR